MSIYLGRIVAVGRTKSGRNAAAYRVSSRSFPNRQIVELGGSLAVVPRPGFENDVFKNPYIAYNCARAAGEWVVLTNGSHTDPLAEKLLSGADPKDAMTGVLLALDYEKDHLKTPRIAAVVPLRGDTAWLGIVRHDALVVKEVLLKQESMQYLSTYEANDIGKSQVVGLGAETAGELAQEACTGGDFRVRTPWPGLRRWRRTSRSRSASTTSPGRSSHASAMPSRIAKRASSTRSCRLACSSGFPRVDRRSWEPSSSRRRSASSAGRGRCASGFRSLAR